jgi:glycosyltransferase involved in cell wall biosynthesis
VVLTSPDGLIDVAGLPDSIVVSFCNTRFLEHAGAFQGLGCRVVWVNCMCWQFPQEKIHYRHENPLFDRYVFQTRYQRDQLTPQLNKWDYSDEQGVLIRGCFDSADFPHEPLPHDRGSRFMVGRLSRNGLDKWPADLWAQYARVPHPTSVRVMGWSEKVEEKVGEPPRWAQTLLESEEPARKFFRSIHAMAPGVGCCAENWPRVGLEAMAAGVPIVAERKGGWIEMLDGAGVLIDTIDEQAYNLSRLAYDEQHRMGVICAGYDRLRTIANPKEIIEQWTALFTSLA